MKRTLLLLPLLALAVAADPRDQMAVEAKLEELRSEDAGRRRAAVETLAHIGDPAVEGLRGLLTDGDWQLRREAARALAAIGSEAAQPALTDAGGDVVWTVREAAAPGLWKGAGLAAAAKDPVWRVRSAAATAAARKDPPLARLLFADRVEEVRHATATAMAATASPEFRPEMVALLASAPDAELGIQLFAKIGRAADLPALRPLFDNPDPELAARALRTAGDGGLDIAADVDRYVARAQALHGMAGAQNQKMFMAYLTGIEYLGPVVWPALATRLDHADDGTAVEFAAILSRAADKRAVPALQKLLRFTDPDIRYLALNALDRVDPAAASEAATGMLSDASQTVRVEAAVVLAHSVDGRGALVEKWATLDGMARRVALGALVDSVALDTRGLMGRVLKSAEAWERGMGYEWFLRRHDPTFLQEIEGTFGREQDEENRCRILAGLDQEIAQHAGLFVTAAGDGSSSVRLLAVRALGGLRDRAFGPVLRRATGDGNPAIRARALQGLAATEGLAFVETFTDALLDPDSSVRETAVRILARSPRAATLLPLTVAARDEADSVRWEAVAALALFPEDIAAPLLRARIQAEEAPLIRGAAARAAARFASSAEFLPALAKAEKSPSARAALVEAASEAGGKGAIALLKELAGDENAVVRVAVATGLGRVPDAGSLNALTVLAGDGEIAVRIAATAALGQIPGKDAEKPLWTCAADSNDAVRSSALASLARRGNRDAVARWLDQDPNSGELRADVAQALDDGGEPLEAMAILLGSPNKSQRRLALAGWCCAELRLWEGARLFFQKAAIAGEPHDSGWDWAVQMRAISAAEEGRPEAAGLLRAAVASAGNPAATAGNVAYLLTEALLLPDLALDLAKQATEGPSPSFDALDTLGWAQLRAGHAADADTTLSAILNPPGAIGWLHRATAQSANHREDAAAASLREALTRQPSLAAAARVNSLLAPLFARPELETWK